MMYPIANLTSGTRVQGMPVLIVEKKVAVAKNGKSYADLTVRDKTGTLKCKIWNYEENPEITVGAVVAISGETSTYNGEVQLTIEHIKLDGLTKAEDLCKSTRFNKDKMWAEIFNLVEGFKEPLTKYVAEKILNEFEDKLKKAPAANKMHNAWGGGLLEHVWSMCRMAKPMIEHFKAAYLKPLSADKVYFGLIIHDVGKIWEYDIDNPAYPYAAEGILINHLVRGPAMVYEKCNQWWHKETYAKEDREAFERERAHLMHLLAAHHGTLEWGSPVVPATIEAIMVHHLDNLDCKLMHALELIEGKEGPIPGFSERSWNTKASYLRYNGEA